MAYLSWWLTVLFRWYWGYSFWLLIPSVRQLQGGLEGVGIWIGWSAVKWTSDMASREVHAQKCIYIYIYRNNPNANHVRDWKQQTSWHARRRRMFRENRNEEKEEEEEVRYGFGGTWFDLTASCRISISHIMLCRRFRFDLADRYILHYLSHVIFGYCWGRLGSAFWVAKWIIRAIFGWHFEIYIAKVLLSEIDVCVQCEWNWFI